MFGLFVSAFLVAHPGHGAPSVVRAEVRGSIEATLLAEAGEPGRALAAQVARLLRWHGDVVRDVHPGDSIALAYDADAAEPELVALRYRGEALDFGAYRAPDGRGVLRYFDESGRQIEPVLQQNPVPDYLQITETVQRGSGKRRHRGLDLKAPEGTEVRVPFAARVARVNWSTRINGNCVEVVYTRGPARGDSAMFLHLSRIAPGVRPGAGLAAGAALGEVGSTGRSSAPHLHYQVHDSAGRVLDPLQAHGVSVGQLPAARRDEHRLRATAWDELLGRGPAVN